MNWQQVPVFINNRDRLETGTRELVNWLLDAGMTDIRIIDNKSSYPPLLEYYKTCPVKVIKLTGNYGSTALWDNEIHKGLDTYYVLTDADVVPVEDCPKDLVRLMIELYEELPKLGHRCEKIGPGIRIDNLPIHYDKRNEVVAHESRFFTDVVYKGAYQAPIDTTFALYSAKSAFTRPNSAQYRLSAPYIVEHKPWYSNSKHPSEEEKYYAKYCNPALTTWCRPPVETGWIKKPLPPEVDPCPRCKALCVVMTNGKMRCNQCGVHY